MPYPTNCHLCKRPCDNVNSHKLMVILLRTDVKFSLQIFGQTAVPNSLIPTEYSGDETFRKMDRHDFPMRVHFIHNVKKELANFTIVLFSFHFFPFLCSVTYPHYSINWPVKRPPLIKFLTTVTILNTVV
jgi:hypothetical protein